MNDAAPAAPPRPWPRAASFLRACVIHPGVISVFDQGVVSGANFLTRLIIARVLSQGDLGTFYLIWTVLLAATTAQENLVSLPYTMYRTRKHGPALASYAGSVLVHQLVIAATASAGVLGIAALCHLGAGPDGLAQAAWVLAAAIPCVLLREFVRRMAFAELAAGVAAAVDGAAAILQLVVLVVLVRLDCLSVAAVYGVMGGASALVCAGWFVLKRPRWHFAPQQIVDDWRTNWSFSRWAMGGQLSGLSLYCLPWMLAAVHGEAATGVLAACDTLIGPASLFIFGLNNFLMPKAAQAFAAGGRAALGRVVRWALVAMATVPSAVCAAAWLAGEPVAVLIFGSDYLGTGTVLTVLSLGILADAVGMTAGNGLWALDRPSANFAGDLVQMVVTLVLAAGLVLPMSTLGIALAAAAGRAAGASVRWYYLWQAMRPEHPAAVPSLTSNRGGTPATA